MFENKKPAPFSEGILTAAGAAYLIALFTAGFLTNFLPLGAINTGTILLYLLGGLLSCIGVLYLLRSTPRKIGMTAALVIALTLLTLIKAILDTNPVDQRIQESIILILGVWPFLFFLQMDIPRVRNCFIGTLTTGLFCLSAFAICQSIFANHLPLSLFVLRGDNRFSVDDNQILRPTGLTGNPIIFSGILVFASAYFAAAWLEKRKARYLWGLVASLIANYLTYTRASVVLTIPVLCFVWLLHVKFRIKHKVVVLVALVLAIIGGQYLLTSGANLVIIQRLQNSDPSTIGSTIGHIVQIQDAESAIASHPLTGAGFGSQGNFMGPGNVIVTDGAWWILFLEFGIPLSILAIIALCVMLTLLTKHILQPEAGDRALAITMVSFHAYLIPANFINSAVLGHIAFGLYWAVLGLSLADTYRDELRGKSH